MTTSSMVMVAHLVVLVKHLKHASPRTNLHINVCHPHNAPYMFPVVEGWGSRRGLTMGCASEAEMGTSHPNWLLQMHVTTNRPTSQPEERLLANRIDVHGAICGPPHDGSHALSASNRVSRGSTHRTAPYSTEAPLVRVRDTIISACCSFPFPSPTKK